MTDFRKTPEFLRNAEKADTEAAEKRLSNPTEKYLKALAKSQAIKDYRKALKNKRQGEKNDQA
jgi:hypothetical protein